MNIYWPADELEHIKLVLEGDLEKFYNEARSAIIEMTGHNSSLLQRKAFDESVNLNHFLLKTRDRDVANSIILETNIAFIYQGILRGQKLVLEKDHSMVVISGETWNTDEDWCEKVVWFGNRQGAYIHNFKIEKNSVSRVA